MHELPEQLDFEDRLAVALARCASEAIHRPGSIQPSGVLVVLDRQTLSIRYVSANLEMLMDLRAADILDATFTEVFGPENAGRVCATALHGPAQPGALCRLHIPGAPDLLGIDTLVYGTETMIFVEFETAARLSAGEFEDRFLLVRQALWRLDRVSAFADYARGVVDLIRRLTGFDRVMMYRFDSNWDGEVIAESTSGLSSYQGHRFPAADIPSQARELYTRNPIRLIADIEAAQVPVIGVAADMAGTDLDMTYSGLRSFSPVHIEYLRNMGVRASLSISLLQDGRLWGLIACHHGSPRYIALRDRELNALVGEQVGLKLAYLEARDSAMDQASHRQQLQRLIWSLRMIGSIEGMIGIHGNAILELLGAQGGVLSLGTCQYPFGRSLPQGAVSDIADWLRTLGPAPAYHTEGLARFYPAAAGFGDMAAGILVAPLSEDMREFLLVHRAAVIRTVRWAGRPVKPLVTIEGRPALSPRSSFDTWIETHQDCSEPWLHHEVDAATALASVIIEMHQKCALQSSEEVYRLLANHSTDMILRLDQHGRCTFVSPASADILGYPPEALIGRLLALFIREEDHAGWQKLIQGDDRRGRAETALLRFVHREGGVVWVELLVREVAEGAFERDIVINARDVTERYRYQLAIEQQHRHHARTLDAAEEGVINVDLDARVVYANERAGLIIGLDASALIGRAAPALFPLVYAQDAVTASREHPLLLAMREQQSYQDNNAVLCDVKGNTHPVDFLCTPLVERQVVFGCVLVFRLRRASGQLGQDAETTSMILAETLEAVMVTDAAGRISFVNRAFSEITGYSADEAIGATPKLLKSGIHTPDFYRDLWLSVVSTGRWVGEIWNRRKSGEIYPQWGSISAAYDRHGNVQSYVAVFSDTSKAKQAEEKLFFVANHDVLTGLPNRLQFTDSLVVAVERAKRRGSVLAVLFLDLDRFKIVNDSLGHHLGDRYLQEVAARLKAQTRGEDLLARWGGDEFIMLVEGVDDSTEVAAMARRLLDGVAQHLEIGVHEFVPSASLGISFFPRDAANINDLIKSADTAMYRAKEQGRNRFEFYTSNLTENVRIKLDMAADIRRALREHELLLYYQPQVDCSRLSVTGVEALIRWQHPARGLLSPAVFLGHVEELGLMGELGAWVFREACRQIAAWRDQGIDAPKVAINLAPQQLGPGLVHLVGDLLQEYRIPGNRVELEITEGALSRGAEVIDVLDGLRSLGVALSVDDFGTGYSSLAHVKDFPIDSLKIDKSFIDGIPDDAQDVAIIRTILALASNLSLRVVAEGVETRQQFDFLCAAGVDTAQGYLFSRPIAPAGVVDLLEGSLQLPGV